MKYDVHLFAIVRVKAVNIEANSPAEAAQEAIEQIDLYKLLGRESPAPGIACTEYAEDIVEALVDEVGDIDYENTRQYKVVDNAKVEEIL